MATTISQRALDRERMNYGRPKPTPLYVHAWRVALRAWRAVVTRGRAVARDLAPHAHSIAMACASAFGVAFYLGRSGLRDAVVFVAVAWWLYREVPWRFAALWHGRGDRRHIAYIDHLFVDLCGITPPPTIRNTDGARYRPNGKRRRRIRPRPDVTEFPNSTRYELECPRIAGAITASQLVDSWSLIKTRVGGNCYDVELHERLGNHVTMIIVHGRPRSEGVEATPVAEEVAAEPERFPDVVIFEGGEQRVVQGAVRPFQIPTAEIPCDEPSYEPLSKPRSRPVIWRHMRVTSPGQGAIEISRGEGSEATPPLAAENAESATVPSRPAPPDAVPGSGTLRLWTALCDGNTWTRQRLSLASGMAPGSVSNKLTVWREAGLIEQSDGGWTIAHQPVSV